MRTGIYCLLFVLTVAAGFAYGQQGNAHIRDVQEELRRRNFFFGDVDGKMTPDLVSAIKQYQERKGFTVSGQIDETTAESLNVELATADNEQTKWPDVPILRSDTARELQEAERQLLAKQAAENPDAVSTPAPPAEEPPPSQNLSRERVQALVEGYLRDAETDEIAAQTRYFAYPVDYFGHGLKGSDFVEKDVKRYCRRWTNRNYSLTEPITFAASENEGETRVEFMIEFSLTNKDLGQVSGKSRNRWIVRAEGDDLKIVAINDQRLKR